MLDIETYFWAMIFCYLFEVGAVHAYLLEDTSYNQDQNGGTVRYLTSILVAFLMCWSTVFGLIAVILGTDRCKNGWSLRSSK